MNLARKMLMVVGPILCLFAIKAVVWVFGSNDATGIVHILNNIYHLSVALAAAAAAICVGHAVCKLLRVDFANGPEEISFSLFVGVGVVGLSVLGLGLLGLLRPLPVLLLFALYLSVSLRSWPRIFAVVGKSLQTITQSRETKIVALIFAGLISLLVLRAATPPNTADELIYHLPVTKAFVDQGRVYPLFDNSLGNFSFLVHMIYAVCLLAKADIAARLFSLFLALGTALALYGFCARYLTRRLGVVAMFAFFAAGMVVEVAITTRIDVSLAGMLFLTTYAMFNYLHSQNIRWLLVSAALAGFSLGIKHSAGIWLLLIGVMYLVETLFRRREQVTAVLTQGILYALLAAVVASPWYLKNYLWFGNPLYPLITGEVADFGDRGIRYFNANDEQKLEAHFQTATKEIPDVVREQEQAITAAANSREERNALRWWNIFLKPNRFLMAEPHQYPNYLFLMIPFLVFVRRRAVILWLLLLSIGFVLAITWTSWIGRYLLPAYPALTIVAAYVITSIAERVRALHNLPLYSLAIVLSVVVSASVLSMQKFNSLGFVTGMVSRRDVQLPFTYYKPIDYINNQLPSNARIMLLGVQLNYGIERFYVSDESWFATKWRRLLVHNNSLDEVNDNLKREGYTHILYSPVIFTYAASMGASGTGGMDLMVSQPTSAEHQLLRNWSTFTLYQQKYLETVYSDNDKYYVFRIK
jgi:4-amino-4-deoxy-L-arabinose transferase-like glycosyltransferase